MLQLLYINVAKVDRDVTHVVMGIYDVSSVCSKCFICFQMYVASICFKCSQVFHTYVCKCFIWTLHTIPLVFKYFLGAYTSVSDVCFKCFIYLFLCVITVASGCFKKYTECCTCDSRGEAAGGAGPLLVCSLAPCASTVRTLALR
jgi:hypothetical protein